ncbi:hypothetical protein [Streptomyces phage phiSAJS1]|uniref:hypothetical protein n=1 Tax=Streptomyces phage phiSAJS1 TaxID=1755682 RepID=UPI000E308ECB|nr:hypothetical protein AVT91_p32 [Streptomyces phage phiSAJS1]ALO79389.2 hypothetical protein [Streptomyces phage phiSAJS1]
MARCGCGGACQCALTAGDNVTVTGSGSANNPWVINAHADCADVRACLSNGCGITYNATSGAISVDISEDANNALQCRANGLYVGAGAATVTAGCGLTGNGSVGSPIRANTQTWPFACDLEDNGRGVYCGSDGLLYTDPDRLIDFFTDSVNEIVPGANGIAVPTATDTVVRTMQLSVTNPDPCRDAWIQLWQDVDMDIDLPPGGQAMYGIDGDDLWQFENPGDTTMFSVHTQSGKMWSLSVAAGATLNINMDLTAGLGRNNARIRRIQRTMRAWVFSRN